ncbi:winged helix-turn-helix domain-containing protein [Microvirga lotononidis]|uniref:Putative integral membrane protein n=1 Tax=Microvirga lotononidis TaxID=864069 RepID=I4YZP4_9HYPH|nr:winged helix-turn-helix domain-containing tetratricopeptide repeat protein [Microvirga lotononidis]EIM29436.1 putative integral membrane protein [Microvirga lotononidis]WQO27244.1 winged helix-turn-helix domain-containing tetratricopeptide repeat protein [Microvirga lotononidis]
MRYLFDDFVLDPDRRELRRNDDLIELEPQVFDLLEFLIRTRDRVASRDDLLEAVWHGRIVSESTLSSRINAARAAIGDDGTRQRLIRTLPRRGVRFVGDVRDVQDRTLEAEPEPEVLQASSDSPAKVPSIAVLPFTNMSGGQEDDSFADGTTEEIITGLAQCTGLGVVARNSSFAFKGRPVDVRTIGHELGAGYVLEGSVRRGNGRLRITAQLIDARSGVHLWAERYDGDLRDVFELQDRITASVVAAIEPKLLFNEADRVRRRPPQSLDAYDLYLRGLSLINAYNAEAATEALQCFDKALECEPAYAQAMAASACYRGLCQFQGWAGSSEEPSSRGASLAWDAIALAPNDPSVLWMAAFAIWVLAKDGPRSRELFRRSLSINRNSDIAMALAGWVEAATGNPAAGRALIEESRRLNPTPPTPWVALTGMAFTYIVEGKYAEAVRWAEQAVDQNRRFALALRSLAVALVGTGEMDRARLIVDEILKIEPDATVASLPDRMPHVSEPVLRTYIETLGRAGLPQGPV